MKILLLFIDGIGIGKNNPEFNPCADERLTIFNNFSDSARQSKIPYGGVVKAIDATLGVPGLPQSATGQTTLLTGVNAAQILNQHLSAYPNQKLREIIERESILKKYVIMKKSAAFINAYRPVFFEYGPQALIRRLSVTSIANWKAGLKFFSIDDINAENAIYHDFTNYELTKKGFKVKLFSAENAGIVLAQNSDKYDFCLYEYFKTDKAGHSQDLEESIQILIQLEQFILSILKNSNLQEKLIILTSDHGNIEDLSIKTHTYNLAPLIVWGKYKDKILAEVNSIVDVTNAILKIQK